MWSSISQIIKPEQMEDVENYLKASGSSLYAGGSYLVSEQAPEITTLIDINHLLDDNFNTLGGDLHIGAGCTLQKMMLSDNGELSKAIVSSCPSKNIRNQRTLGGEIARSRPDSDLLVYLFAAQAMLKINTVESPQPISNWAGEGVILEVIIPQNSVKMERVSVLDSAPAFVIVGVNQIDESISIAVGGKSNRILFCATTVKPDEAQIRNFMDKVSALYQNDHFGSPDFKQHIVSRLLREMVVSK